MPSFKTKHNSSDMKGVDGITSHITCILLTGNVQEYGPGRFESFDQLIEQLMHHLDDEYQITDDDNIEGIDDLRGGAILLFRGKAVAVAWKVDGPVPADYLAMIKEQRANKKQRDADKIVDALRVSTDKDDFISTLRAVFGDRVMVIDENTNFDELSHELDKNDDDPTVQ